MTSLNALNIFVCFYDALPHSRSYLFAWGNKLSFQLIEGALHKSMVVPCLSTLRGKPALLVMAAAHCPSASGANLRRVIYFPRLGVVSR